MLYQTALHVWSGLIMLAVLIFLWPSLLLQSRTLSQIEASHWQHHHILEDLHVIAEAAKFEGIEEMDINDEALMYEEYLNEERVLWQSEDYQHHRHSPSQKSTRSRNAKRA